MRSTAEVGLALFSVELGLGFSGSVGSSVVKSMLEKVGRGLVDHVAIVRGRGSGWEGVKVSKDKRLEVNVVHVPSRKSNSNFDCFTGGAELRRRIGF